MVKSKKVVFGSAIVGLAILGISCRTIEVDDAGYDDKTPVNKNAVYFYNVENLFDTIDQQNVIDEDFLPTGKLKWNTERYQKKLAKIVEALSLDNAENPMLIGLSEIENNSVLKDLIKTGKFKKTKYAFAHFDSPDDRGIDCALLYDSKKFKFISKEKLKVKIDSLPDFKTRDVLYVKGTIKGTEMHVFVNHWPSRRSGEAESEVKRIAAAITARKKIDEILKLDPNANIILMGDLNDHPDNVSVDKYLKAKPTTDASADLYDLFYDDHLAGKGSHSFKGKWGVLDHIIVSKNLYSSLGKIKIVNKDAEIVKNKKLIFTYDNGEEKPSSTYGGDKYYGGFSDHLPVRMYLQF